MLDNAENIMQASLRIDATIDPISYLRVLLYIGLAGIIGVLAWLAELLLWQYLIVLIISLAVATYLALSRPKLSHLSQPPLGKLIDQEWQLLMRTGRGDELWLANLDKVQRYQWLLAFEFTTSEPFIRRLTVIIYRDQVNFEEWRQLNILANIIGPKLI
ncbi:hypothetical protein [uncultured Psychrobacter sp.]|uniref:hypothetical protein n=1 Tax=uncultured Psychrobacter sp. TaxID=259303 RepID=UPI0034577AC3